MINHSKTLGENLKEELNKTEYGLDLPPELEIQEDLAKYRKEGKESPLLQKPLFSSTLLKTKEINKFYDEVKEKFLQTAITIKETDLDVAVENAEESNKEVINMIDPTPGLIVDYTLNLDKQFEYNSNDLERTFDLSNQVQERLDKLLSLMKENTRPSIDMWMTEKPTEKLPNDPLSSEKSYIKTEGINIDDNYLNNIQFFPKPSTDERKDFEIKVGGDNLIVYKLPMLTTVNISRKNLNNALNNILEDLNANIEDFQTHSGQKANRRRIRKIKRFINKIDSEEKLFFENKLAANSWLKKLIDDQLKNEENHFTFRDIFQEFEPIGNTLKGKKIRKKPCDNVTLEKEKFCRLPLKVDLKNYQVFILKFQQTILNTKKIAASIRLQNDPKSVFYTTTRLNKSILKKEKKAVYDKDKVFVNLNEQLEDKDFYKNENLLLVTPFVNKRTKIDRSTLYSFSKPFQAIHDDIVDLRFLPKVLDLFTSKIYVFPM